MAQCFSEPKKIGAEREETLVEIRHGSEQTVMPPSYYEKDGNAPAERSGWSPCSGWQFGVSGLERDKFAGIPLLKSADYQKQVKRLAAATLIARNLPTGSRHFFWLYLGGAMARSGWSREEATQFHFAIVNTFRDFRSHDADIIDSFEKHGKGEPVAGLEKMDGIIGHEVTNKLVKWLALQDAAADNSKVNDATNLDYILSKHTGTLQYCPQEEWYRLTNDRWNHVDAGIVADIVRQELEKRFEEIVRQASTHMSGEELRKKIRSLESLLFFGQHNRITTALEIIKTFASSLVSLIPMAGYSDAKTESTTSARVNSYQGTASFLFRAPCLSTTTQRDESPSDSSRTCIVFNPTPNIRTFCSRSRERAYSVW